MLQYKIEFEPNHRVSDLQDSVSALINQGWVTVGGLTVSGDYLYQALVKATEC